jgi:aromatic-L-amino-acid/L-tryptophan decarboxylase
LSPEERDPLTTDTTADAAAEETLDPQDWTELRALGHRMVDDMLDWLQSVRERPVWQPMPEEAKARLREPLPEDGEDVGEVYRAFLRDIRAYAMGNIHPRFWGWVMGNGTPLGMLAEMLASGMNPNVGGGEHSAVYVERQVIAWTKEMLGYPAEASGLLVSGGSEANLLGLAVARHARAGFDVRREGVQAAQQRLTVYASREAHSSIQKAVELLGLGNASLCLVPVDEAFRIHLDALEDAIAADRAEGLRPICVVGNAGTVNSGALDDLNALADLASREGLWFHVDGAIGAPAALSPRLRPRVAGMERADSLALDFHKWMYVPFPAGCVLVRDAEMHRRAFTLTPEYLESHGTRGLASGTHWPNEYGLQLTRSFQALKIWMSLKEHGVRKYARLVEQNVAQAAYLGKLVEQAPDLELLAPVSLNIVCFRYRAPGCDEGQLNALNQELLIRLHESGAAAPTYTTLEGRYALRAAITNHRSWRSDFDVLVREVRRIGQELCA